MVRKRGGKNNAITHGAYSEDLILPGESVREFKLLHRGLIEEWKPTGALEEDTVLTIAQCIWLKRRVDRFYYDEASWAQEHPKEEDLEDAFRRAKMLEKVHTVNDVTEIVDQLPELYKTYLEQAVPRSNFKDENDWIQFMKTRVLDFLVQHKLVIIAQIDSRKFRAVKAGEVRELTAKKIALDERLDARIDKAIKRLAQLKAFKQIVKEQASQTRSINQRSIVHHRQ